MSLRSARVAISCSLAIAVVILTACGKHAPKSNAARSSPAPAGTVVAVTALPATATTPTPTASPKAGATAVNGATFKIGAVSVVVDQFRAQVTAAGGVNIRSAPQVTPDNRIGSLVPGAVVTVEGRVPAGQEAEPGHGTLWYFLGIVGSTPQFVYGAPGTLQPLTGSATPGPIPTASVVATPPGTPLATPPGLPTPPPPPTLPPTP
jgi:hypothetical protein